MIELLRQINHMANAGLHQDSTQMRVTLKQIAALAEAALKPPPDTKPARKR